LINTPKANITQICKKNNIPFVIDTSNADNTTSIRNRLRNQVLPQFYALSKSKASQKTFEQSMLNIYEELQKAVREDSIFPVSITNSSLDTRPASLVPRHPSRIPISDQSPNLQPISKSPSRKAKFAYQRDTPQKEISIENIISILNQLGICKNISSRFLNDLLIFLQTSHSGYKYFQKTYFFVAHSKIYIIQAPENFRMKYIKNPSTEA
jgi:tRNA(Ile)-lysidine synthase TilS/MesJ